ncbi:MAG: PP2C family protein-serine/threonine phosphatase [Leptospira sp.]|nr:PP2C family protein-serine/threonine phosphatase [Leptospira sp.]
MKPGELKLKFRPLRGTFDIFKTKSFLKLFISLIVFVILPFAFFISNFLYQNYKETLDWNYRFQLTRVQLMSIDFENHIRDHLSTQSKEKNYFWTGNRNDLEENKVFNQCLNENQLTFSYGIRKIFQFTCPYDNVQKNWILLYENKNYWIYSAEFLEDLLLDSPFSEPNESIFLLNQDGDFGLSSQIESDFRIPSEWFEILAKHASENEKLPKIRDVEVNKEGYFLSSFPMYGLPFHLFVSSPKETMLVPVRDNFIKNVLFLLLLFAISLIFSALISGREMEDKRKLNIVFREFPHAAMLYDADGKELLSNPNLESEISIRDLFIDKMSVYEKLNQEAKKFLDQVYGNKEITARTRIEEWETVSNDGEKIFLEIELHLWFLENNSSIPRGTLIIVQDISAKKLEFEKEMVYAKILQKKYLPQNLIKIPEIEYDFYYLPLLHVSGDYYDFIKLNDNKYLFVLGDIVGHGVQAAMMMTVVRVLFHQILKETTEPSQILLKMNSGVRDNLPEALSFVPFHFIIFDFNIQKAHYANAGHPGMIHIQPDGNVKVPERLNPMLGMLPSFVPKILEFDINKGDRFFMFTDGLTDVRNSKQESIGGENLIQFFKNAKQLSLNETKSNLVDEIKSHAQGVGYPDDITWIGIEIKEFEKFYRNILK